MKNKLLYQYEVTKRITQGKRITDTHVWTDDSLKGAIKAAVFASLDNVGELSITVYDADGETVVDILDHDLIFRIANII